MINEVWLIVLQSGVDIVFGRKNDAEEYIKRRFPKHIIVNQFEHVGLYSDGTTSITLTCRHVWDYVPSFADSHNN